MSSTRTLASYLSKIRCEDLPPEVVEKGKIAIVDALGNAIGGYPLPLSNTFLELAKDLGGGRDQATLIGDGTKVSVPMAAFGNGALSTMLDYCDAHRSDSGRCPAWPGALAVPAALAAGEAGGISGKDLIASVVAGYECTARILHSMDMTLERSLELAGETVSVFSAAGAAARALGLTEDEFLSALGMTGIYTPVPAGHKWLSDDGLTPRKDIKQGWAWMCLTGTFAAVSAQKGLKMLQQNNVLDGDNGLWRMLGMDIFKEEQLTAELGQKYYILEFATKPYPGCAVTHTAIAGVTGLVSEHNIDPVDIEAIEVITNKQDGIGFNAPDPEGLSDIEFSMPYQIGTALLAGDGGPNWYTDRTAKSTEISSMMGRVSLSFDEECEKVFRDSHLRMSKVTVQTKAGQRYTRRVDRVSNPQTVEEIRNKFITTTTQVIERDRVDRILNTLDSLETLGNVSELLQLISSLPSEPR